MWNDKGSRLQRVLENETFKEADVSRDDPDYLTLLLRVKGKEAFVEGRRRRPAR